MSNYLHVSGIRYPSRARLYCVHFSEEGNFDVLWTCSVVFETSTYGNCSLTMRNEVIMVIFTYCSGLVNFFYVMLVIKKKVLWLPVLTLSNVRVRYWTGPWIRSHRGEGSYIFGPSSRMFSESAAFRRPSPDSKQRGLSRLAVATCSSHVELL